ncbi:MAG: YjfB family protein [Lachnospiraceae bacterium]|nr:YjfB family protein [Lachnospiraceae bacterium]
MDIAGLSTNLAQTQLLNSVGTAVLSQSLEQAKDLSANMVEMLDAAAMERSVNPDIGANIDIMI